MNRGKFDQRGLSEWNSFLAEVGSEHGATVQLAEVIGKRWHYLAGETSSDAGLLGMVRIDLGNGYGAIIFPHSRAFSNDARDIVRRLLVRKLRDCGFC